MQLGQCQLYKRLIRHYSLRCSPLSMLLFSCSENKIICLNIHFMLALNWLIIILTSMLSPTPKNNNGHMYVLCSFYIHMHMQLKYSSSKNLVGRLFKQLFEGNLSQQHRSNTSITRTVFYYWNLYVITLKWRGLMYLEIVHCSYEQHLFKTSIVRKISALLLPLCPLLRSCLVAAYICQAFFSEQQRS